MSEETVKTIEETGLEPIISDAKLDVPEGMPHLKEESENEQSTQEEGKKNKEKKKKKEKQSKETHKFVESKEVSQQRTKEKTKEIIVQVGCRILGVFIILWMLAATSMGFIFGWHTTVQMQERNFLSERGYIGKYSAGEYNLNVYRTGNSMGPTIVGLSGLGVQDYGVAMAPVHNELKKDYLFVYVDRAGYALSEDTRETQTVERIVSDYRQALLSANIRPPYVLMPHSIGGVYATYWASMYPNEIEGIIYIDGTPLTADMPLEEIEKSTKTDGFLVELAQIGYSRLVQNKHIDYLPDSYSKDLIEISEILQVQSLTSFAKLSESDESNNNKQSALQALTQTDIPKVYICAYAGFQTKEEVKEYFEWPYNKAVSVEYTDERAEKLLQQVKDIRDTQVIPYVESLGNTELICLPGDHLIYLQKPFELTNIIRNFLWQLYPETAEEIAEVTEIVEPKENSLEELEMVNFMNCAVNKESLSNDTLGWLEWYNNLPEEEQMAIDYVPSDLLEICGMTLEEIIDTPEETEAYTEEFEAYPEEDDSDDEYSEDITWDEPSYG